MAVSDVNMSSEGSGSSSRLRQFGLYKNIDSRTEEFLKLSRKRQIRRGCACAAVSTAITVTVVVSALLVYEYGFRTESKMAPSSLRRFNWFNAVKDSDVKFDKNKDTQANNINNSKLLPIILKALDQKRYLETLIEEHSTTISYDKTSYPLEKNLFTEARNWRASQLKFGEMGNKGPPQGFFRQRHADSFINARKLINFQRIMTYLNSVSPNTNEPNRDHISSTWNPSSSTGTYKYDFSYQNNYNKPESETKITETTETIIDPKNDDILSKDNEKKNCKCTSNSLADILEKLYNSIQQLHKIKIEKGPKSTSICNGRDSENYTSVTVHQPDTFNNLKAPISIRNLKFRNIKIPSKHKKMSFLVSSNKTPTLNEPETATMLSEISASDTYKSNHLTNDQKIMPVVQNDEYMRHRVNIFKEEMIPWELGINTNEVTTPFYMHTNKIDNFTPTSQPVIKIKEKDGIATVKEKVLTGMEAITKKGYINEDEKHDSGDEISNLLPGANQNLNAHSAHVDKEKHNIFEEYNYLANYMNGINTVIAPSVETTTENPFDLKLRRFYSYETVDPLVELEKSTTESPSTFNPIPWRSEKQRMNSKLPPPHHTKGSGENRKKGPLKIHTTEKPYFISKLEKTTEGVKQPHGNVLPPMIQSYLLSKYDSGILDLNFDTTTSVNTTPTKDSEELPFDLTLFSNEQSDHVSKTNINIFHTTPTTSMRPLDKGETQLKKNTNTRNSEIIRVKRVKKKKGSKEWKLPKAQTWTSPTIDYPKTFTNVPAKTEPKNHKIKPIFYMTGSETPPEDFESNLHELMYFDRNPFNYTAIANYFLNKTDSGSIEITKSMMPETQPSYLEIRRNYNQEEVEFDTHVYDEQKLF